MAAVIPLASNGSWVVCNEVEQFLLDRQDDESEPTLEELGQLSRLLSDLRLDAQHLSTIADDVEELLRGARAAADASTARHRGGGVAG